MVPWLAASARAEPPVHVDVTMHADAAFAVGRLADVTSRLGGIVGVGALMWPRSLPLALGFDLSGLFFLSHTERRALQDFPQLSIETDTQTRALLAHLVLRAQLPLGDVQPFIEGRFGLKHFRTRTTLSLGGNLADVALDAESRPTATVRSGGLGLGLDWISRQKYGQTKSSQEEGSASLSVHWLPGAVGTFSAGEIRDRRSDQPSRSVRVRTSTGIVSVSLTFRGRGL